MKEKTSPTVVSFNPDRPPSFMTEVWIRGAGPEEFHRTFMKSLPRRGDILYDKIAEKHLVISSIQWFEREQHDWIAIINLDRGKNV